MTQGFLSLVFPSDTRNIGNDTIEIDQLTVINSAAIYEKPCTCVTVDEDDSNDTFDTSDEKYDHFFAPLRLLSPEE